MMQTVGTDISETPKNNVLHDKGQAGSGISFFASPFHRWGRVIRPTCRRLLSVRSNLHVGVTRAPLMVLCRRLWVCYGKNRLFLQKNAILPKKRLNMHFFA